MEIDAQTLIFLGTKFALNHKEALMATNIAFLSAAQQLATIQNTLVQSHGGTGDDPALLALFQNASRSPGQGML